ncbi:MAG: ABC transporter permease [Saccharofermentans sp.]|nr:ABC transporter permease [Saccharofermentans sp.]
MYAIYKRDFLQYFRSPVGYVAIAIFSFLAGFIFYSQYANGSVSISSEVISLRSFFVVIVPIITMASFAEDKKRGTEVLYYTTPVDLFSVVAGKFLAAMSLLAVMFINVFVHMLVTVSNGGIVDMGAWGSVIVFFFMAAMFVSIGLLASSLNDNQIISAIVTFISILFIQILATISDYTKTAVNAVVYNITQDNEFSVASGEKAASVINWLDPFARTSDFRSGVFSVSALVFCISFAIVFLYITYRVLEKKRWSQG